jgi:hypothetical protein
VGLLGHTAQDVERYGALQCLPVGEAPVQRGDAYARSPGDFLKRSVWSMLHEDLTGRLQELVAVAAGIGAQARRTAGHRRSSCLPLSARASAAHCLPCDALVDYPA